MSDAALIFSSCISVLFLILLTLLCFGADFAPDWAKSKSALAFLVVLVILTANPMV